ncbi:MAG: hypothetical protein NC928_03010 [Candidatus Omnitrophica bacterium]|nr:hypothetical protein [Candidatus Omnitrophota bacterium]
MPLDETRFIKIIQELIKFKSAVSRLPIKAESWEEIIWASLVFMYGQDKIEWDPQSHEKSIDLKVRIDGRTFRVSAKAGEIKNDILSISSYRLTTFNKLPDMLHFIKEQHKNFDFYLICARNVAGRYINYSVFKIEARRMNPPWFGKEKNWQKTKGGYELKVGFGFNAKIVFKMSNQLWYYLPLKYLTKKERIVKLSIPRKDLGGGLIEFLKGRF